MIKKNVYKKKPDGKNDTGRPMKFKSVKELQKEIDKYFKECDDKKEYYTITGLALALNTTRKVVCEYEHRDEFRNTIKRAKLIVENDYEKSLRKRGSSGDIFGLKNFGWKDKMETEHSGEIGVISEGERRAKELENEARKA